jgi:hypothetical protein
LEGDDLRLYLQTAGGGRTRLPVAQAGPYKHPPEFAVFQGTNRLAAGKFEFG